MLYFDDLSVGQQFRSQSHMVSHAEIVEFASKYDPQPHHLDLAAANEHPIFKGIVASGWHTSAITMRLWTQSMPMIGGLLGLESSVKWLKPVRPNDHLRTEVEIIALQPSASKPYLGMVSYSSKTLNQNNEVVMQATARIAVKKRSA